MDYNNICILMDAGPKASLKCLEKFSELPFENKILLSSDVDNVKYPFAINLKCYQKGYNDSLIRHISKWRAKRYLYEFDVVTFINNGGKMIRV